jgi:hypothetical protein
VVIDKILMALQNARSQIALLGSSTDEVNQAHLKELDDAIALLTFDNPDRNGFFYWILKVGVQRLWVGDGADFTDERVHSMLATHWGHVYGHELKGKVLARPPDAFVAQQMGFKTVAEYLRDRNK